MPNRSKASRLTGSFRTPCRQRAGRLRFINPITPIRILDTRTTNGGHPAALAAGETMTLQVLGRGAVPLSGVAAIVGNVTVVPGAAGGHLIIWPAGYPKPTASNINFPATALGVVPIANLFTCAVGPTGAIAIFDGYGAGAHVIIDVEGWISADPLDAVGPSVLPPPAVPTASDSVKAAQVLTTAVGYLMSTWWPGPAQTLLATPLTQSVPNDAVRRLSMAALGLSTAWAGGLSADPVLLARTVQLVDRVAAGHVTNAQGGWGEGWQSPMWAALCGRAAWYCWSYMPASTRLLVARMVAHEADYASRRQIHYLRNAAGAVLTAGDTGAEEVSWWGGAMQVAQVMLPTHPHVSIWATEMQRFALAAAARPQDVAAWSAWITGSNVEANGTLRNHDRDAPDYAACLLYQNLDAVPLLALAGKPTPQAQRELLGPVYAALNALYVPGTATVTYPQGCDWGTGQMLPYALADAQADTYGYNPGSAAQYLGLHLDAQLAMQARHADGHTYASDAEYNYVGREEHAAQLAAQLWWTLRLRDLGLGSFS